MATAVAAPPAPAAAPHQQAQQQQQQPGNDGQHAAVQLQHLQFSYPSTEGPFLHNMNLELPRGSRCLLIGANGAGKTTLLQLIAGKYMVPRDAIRVLSRSPFYDMVRRAREGTLAARRGPVAV
jgi:CCR4-NOT complex subunit CAF16